MDLGSNFCQKKGSSVSNYPLSRAAVRAHPSVENFWIHIQLCLLSRRLQMPPSVWGWLSGTWFQYNLSSHFQPFICIYVGLWFVLIYYHILIPLDAIEARIGTCFEVNLKATFKKVDWKIQFFNIVLLYNQKKIKMFDSKETYKEVNKY